MGPISSTQPHPFIRMATSSFIPPHGGYDNLLSFRKTRIVYDATVRFCERFHDHRDRTVDQMLQAACSGKQNILEGSQASGTSKEMEIKLVNVARASLEEILPDPSGELPVGSATPVAGAGVSRRRRPARTHDPRPPGRPAEKETMRPMGLMRPMEPHLGGAGVSAADPDRHRPVAAVPNPGGGGIPAADATSLNTGHSAVALRSAAEVRRAHPKKFLSFRA